MKADKTKILGGTLVVAGIGIAGYFGYKLYSEYKAKQVGTSLGALTDGQPDHNAKIASAYWLRQRELFIEQKRLRAMGL
jgi:hypothetical protein